MGVEDHCNDIALGADESPGLREEGLVAEVDAIEVADRKCAHERKETLGNGGNGSRAVRVCLGGRRGWRKMARWDSDGVDGCMEAGERMGCGGFDTKRFPNPIKFVIRMVDNHQNYAAFCATSSKMDANRQGATEGSANVG